MQIANVRDFYIDAVHGGILDPVAPIILVEQWLRCIR